jgi:hypothetical protein
MRSFGPTCALLGFSLSFPRLHDLNSQVCKVFDVFLVASVVRSKGKPALVQGCFNTPSRS